MLAFPFPAPLLFNPQPLPHPALPTIPGVLRERGCWKRGGGGVDYSAMRRRLPPSRNAAAPPGGARFVVPLNRWDSPVPGLISRGVGPSEKEVLAVATRTARFVCRGPPPPSVFGLGPSLKHSVSSSCCCCCCCCRRSTVAVGAVALPLSLMIDIAARLFRGPADATDTCAKFRGCV